MKKLLLIFALVVPITGFSQVQYIEVTNSYLKSMQNKWYKNREDKKENKKDFLNSLRYAVQGMDLVVIPGIYNPAKDTNLVSIEFIQDSIHFHSDYIFTQPKTKILDKNLSIGAVMDYMIDAEHVGVLIKKTYTDGSINLTHIKMHLDIVLLYCGIESEQIKTPEPINIYYEYGLDWD